LIRDPLGQFETQALLCTDLQAAPAWMLDCFVQRWQLEVTFEEARAHLGIETQRQWSDKAIARTTPCLFGLYSIVTLLAQHLFSTGQLYMRRAAWYAKPQAFFHLVKPDRYDKNPSPFGRSLYRLALLCDLNG
jgi:hypothetical protein